MANVNDKSNKIEQEAIDAIVSAAENIEFGQIVIKIQNRKIVQIESLERKRIRSATTDRQNLVEYQI